MNGSIYLRTPSAGPRMQTACQQNMRRFSYSKQERAVAFPALSWQYGSCSQQSMRHRTTTMKHDHNPRAPGATGDSNTHSKHLT